MNVHFTNLSGLLVTKNIPIVFFVVLYLIAPAYQHFLVIHCLIVKVAIHVIFSVNVKKKNFYLLQFKVFMSIIVLVLVIGMTAVDNV